MNYGEVKLSIAGKIAGAEDVHSVLSHNVDFVAIGKAAILHHDFPFKVIGDPHFESQATPVSESYLQKEGLGKEMIKYMKRWPGFRDEKA